MALYTKPSRSRQARKGPQRTPRSTGLGALGRISRAFLLDARRFAAFLGLQIDPVLASLQQAASAGRVIGVAPAPAQVKQALGLQIDQQALSLIDPVQQGLRRSPATGPRLGVDPAALGDDTARIEALTDARAPLDHALSRVSDGQRSLEAWLALAHRKILVQVVTDLLDPTMSDQDRTRLLIDADEILQDELERLQELVDARQAGAALRGQQAGELAQVQRFQKLLQVMAALRNHEQVPPQDLDDMAYFYAEVLDEPDPDADPTGAAVGTKPAGHKSGKTQAQQPGGTLPAAPAAPQRRHQRGTPAAR